ncbi:MAG: Crp/Fnr family transcriptional regulator [Oscillospiraceae bacterium]|jgi:CRP-like cAMP-binding protein|nr:Crp/Fnr family transcriptional regulator [Oscillospiraceae bacterium]MCI8758855.1 Crp/Fnr family transcriptional regulator [Oscillospiraceae bacterium]MCI9563876.1 Crp/Fnr family transcriptional regulator [Oscillospiraceae bacterium]
MEYGSLALFYDITDQEVEAMIQCFRMRRCRFHPGQIICTYGESAGEVGVLVSGEAELVRLDYAGNRTILERLETGGVFGESLAFTPTLGDCVEVVSAAGSEVLFMEYSHIMKRCENACAHHSKLVQNMFRLVAEQTRRLSQRVEVLSRRSIRDKLMCWFQLRRLAAGADSFTLPFTLSALADYISADRSAMMRELKRMKEEGLVEMDGRRVTLRTGEG